MHKYLFLLLLCASPFFVKGQQRNKIELLESASSHYTKVGNEDIAYVKKPRFRHENAILTCDSAVFYATQNTFEAYGNVHIQQADTVNVYSKRLNYNGNTKLAHLTESVRLLDGKSTLTTEILDYDLGTRIGRYTTNGRIVNKDIRITSRHGTYFGSSRDAYFKYNVVAVTEQTTITSDTLRYNTLSNNAYFYGPTNIKGKDDNLYTENGIYNTKTEDAYFGKNNLYTQGSRSMKGDSLYYYGKRGYGKAVKNIVYTDTADNTVLRGHLGEYFKDRELVTVTQNAYVGMQTSDSVTVDGVKRPDSLWISADTLQTRMVLQSTLKLIPAPVMKTTAQLAAANSESEDEPPGAENGVVPPVTIAPDSLRKVNSKQKDSANMKPPAAPRPVTVKDSLNKSPVTAKAPPVSSDSTSKVLDTVKTRVINAFYKVKVFKTNLQAKADSLFYTSADSTLRWYRNPIIWAEGSQQTGDTIYAQFKNKKLNTVEILSNGFIVNVEEDSLKYNQIKGKTILGFFINGELNKMVVDGNAESIYFDKDNRTKKYTHVNQNISTRVLAVFEKKELRSISNVLNHEGKRTPMGEIVADPKLTGFTWKPEERPKSKVDVIGAPYVAPAKKKPVSPAKKVTPGKKRS